MKVDYSFEIEATERRLSETKRWYNPWGYDSRFQEFKEQEIKRIEKRLEELRKNHVPKKKLKE